MKGPFTTQTLRGLRNSGAMHWRGDRSTGQFGTAAFDSNVSFLNFVAAFQGLVGSPDAPSEAADADVRRTSSCRCCRRPTPCATWTIR